MNRTLALLPILFMLFTLSACSGDSSMDNDPIGNIPARLTGTWTGVVVTSSNGDNPPEEQPVSITIVQGVEVGGVLRVDQIGGTGTITTQVLGELTFEIEGEYVHPSISLNLMFTVVPPFGTIQGNVSEDRRTILASMAGPGVGGSVTFMLERQ